jgi:hypothetical protein
VDALARSFVADASLDVADAVHLAHVALRPWVGRLVTSDDKFRARARPLDLPHTVEILSAVEAVDALHIAPGEVPKLAPLPGSPLDGQTWWLA